MGNNNGRGKVVNMVRESAKELKPEVEGYLVRRVFLDQGAAMQVMFKHYFDNLSLDIKARLTPTQTELVGFFGEQFTIVRASSPYNIILGRTCLRELRVVSSTVHAMMKFPTPKGIATINDGATYQRLVDSTFQTQLRRNLEAYVDDMVIKRKTEQDMIMDIAETFDNLRKINMKLNPMKCSFNEVLIRCRGGKVPRLYGHLGRNKGEPQEDEGNIRHAIP
ncbi:hypothetical protein Tco_1433681 [Tanacetum coccineum]